MLERSMEAIPPAPSGERLEIGISATKIRASGSYIRKMSGHSNGLVSRRRLAEGLLDRLHHLGAGHREELTVRAGRSSVLAAAERQKASVTEPTCSHVGPVCLAMLVKTPARCAFSVVQMCNQMSSWRRNFSLQEDSPPAALLTQSVLLPPLKLLDVAEHSHAHRLSAGHDGQGLR